MRPSPESSLSYTDCSMDRRSRLVLRHPSLYGYTAIHAILSSCGISPLTVLIALILGDSPDSSHFFSFPIILAAARYAQPLKTTVFRRKDHYHASLILTSFYNRKAIRCSRVQPIPGVLSSPSLSSSFTCVLQLMTRRRDLQGHSQAPLSNEPTMPAALRLCHCP